MSVYYVRKTVGSDANPGTSAGSAWETLSYAFSSTSGLIDGDIVYVGAGVYRESVLCDLAQPTTAAVSFLADVTGAYTGDAGEVRWTNFLTSDTAVPSAYPCIDLQGCPRLVFEGFHFHGGEAVALLDASGSGAAPRLSVRDCVFTYQSPNTAGWCILWRATPDVTNTSVIERCRFFSAASSSGAVIGCLLPPSTTAAYDVDMTIRNCWMVAGGGATGGANGVTVATYASGGSNYPGGVRVLNSTYVGRGSMMAVTSSSMTTNSSLASCCRNSLAVTPGTALSAVTSGTLLESYNRLVAGTARSNVTSGTGSVSDASHALLLHLGQEQAAGLLPRTYLTPTIDSPLLGFDNATSPTPPTVDLLNRVRPSGPGVTWTTALKAAGCLERHDFGVSETTTVDTSGVVSLKMSGPGSQEFRVPVAQDVACVLSVRVYRDGTYAGTAPQLQLLAAPELGVSAQSVTDAGSASAWNTITLSSFTPSANGVVVVRFVSNSTTGGGVSYWDNFDAS